ncbi:hypothetical protein AKJ47_01245 [candidate division MSBL1 archaeon SCGC-AAA261G05]|uniref:Uncharacterized protein n=2 Tax=candidate division MSBL1 TaxID=215777 RepID=A0A133VBY3_9EURY|nr:hypothetical protein AKJ47_01245 [candidate division MSBL1 archaeon SCGC-AAA261G05]KXB04807.1 hypothetical protein AKJ48_01370 [candidate division MSBL1 archaeon SCGC-AAA261O19]
MRISRRAVKALRESSDREEIERARQVPRKYPQTYLRVTGGWAEEKYEELKGKSKLARRVR